MKNKALGLIIITLISGQHLHAQQFDWLVGTWKLKDKPVYETWKKVNEKNYRGESFKVVNHDTTSLEKIVITYRDGHYHYIPDVPENEAPVDFKFSSFNDDGFIAENPSHDFPKLIRYTIVRKGKEGNYIEASIAGNGKVISYSFKRLE